MKNAIFTGSRKNKLASAGMIAVMLIFIPFQAGCMCEFESINQPYQADTNSSFEVQITATLYFEGSAYFGIMLPSGWLVEDTIECFYHNGILGGMFIYSENLTMDMTIIDPPPDGYYWWAAECYNSWMYFEYHFGFNIYSDGQTGNFFLDYMLGSDDEGPNYRRSNEHHIITGPCYGCAPEGIVLSNQSDIDNFTNNFPDCGAIAGDVKISGDDITNLDGLNGITSIGGFLWFWTNASLTSLTGMDSLTSIGGGLYINVNSSLTYIQGLNSLTSVGRHLMIGGNHELVNISGLNALTEIGIDMSLSYNSLISFTGMNNLLSIGRDLIIENNDELNSIPGMSNLTSIGGHLYISNNASLNNLTGLNNLASIGVGGNINRGGYINNNASLTSLFGLENLTTIGGWLGIYDNAALVSLTGLEGLTSIEGSFEIHDNAALVSLTGLEGLTSVGNLFIYENAALVNLTGLEGLTSIEGSFEIHDNAALVSLTGLEGLTSIGGSLSIYSNPLLCHCEIDAICAYLAGQNGSIYINDNAAGCSTMIDVALACGPLPCPEEGTYYLYNQFDVDHFLAVFPGCTEILCNIVINGDDITNLDSLAAITSIGGSLRFEENASLVSLTGLEGLTSIGGSLSIRENASLVNLTGLEGLTSIGGGLGIGSNDALVSLTGLDNLTSIGGNLGIGPNDALVSLTGLEGLTSIGGYLRISYNDALASLEGLEALTSIGDYLYVEYNEGLSNLSGLEGLTSIGGYLRICYNDTLASLEGLEALTSIGGYLYLYDNDALTSLAGLEGLAYIGGDLTIRSNQLLCNCEIDAICAYLADPNGVIQISYNAVGCSTIIEVAAHCGTTLPCLGQGTYNLTSQFLIDHFPAVFPGCSDIACNVSISGDDIVNLDSLCVITSIQGSLSVKFNPFLTSLAGLEGLTSIGNYLGIVYNDVLVSLAGLENVTFIGGDLYIRDNPLLCNCEIDAICAYLADPNGVIQISDNAPGCDSGEEVEAACLVGVEESAVSGRRSAVRIFPNPSADLITIELAGHNTQFQLSIFNISGQEIIRRQITESQTVVDVSGLNTGIYFVKVVSDDGVLVGKFLKQ